MIAARMLKATRTFIGIANPIRQIAATISRLRRLRGASAGRILYPMKRV